MSRVAAVAIAVVAVVAAAGGRKRSTSVDAGVADPCAVDANHPPFRYRDGGTRVCVVVEHVPLTVACRDMSVDGGECVVRRADLWIPSGDNALQQLRGGQAGDFGPYESPYVQPAGSSFDKPDLSEPTR